MLCPMCNGNIARITGSLFFDSKVLGRISVPGISYLQCQECEDITIDLESTKLIHSFIERKEREAISSLPINEFVTLNEASEILGITKQAFSKNSRINRGFIYSVKVGNSKLYYRKSVDEFKRTGKDGRIRIFSTVRVVEVPKYVFVSIPEIKTPVYSEEFSAVYPRISDVRNYVIQ